MTIHGNPRKGTGILNNKRYRGILCFNRGHGLRDPDTNKRRHRPNPPNEWITTEVPEQRIIDDELWERVKKRQLLGIDRRLKGPGARHAPLPHLAHYCALCGGGMVIHVHRSYRCATRRAGGPCAMNRGIHAADLEARAMAHLREWTETRADLPTAFGEALDLLTAERDRIARTIEEKRLQIENVLRTIADGAMAPSLPRYLYRLEREAAHLDVEQRRLTVPTTGTQEDLSARLAVWLDALERAITSTVVPERRHQALLQMSDLLERIDIAPGNKRGETRLTVHPFPTRVVAFALRPVPEGLGVSDAM